jgi:hypothetical protein
MERYIIMSKNIFEKYLKKIKLKRDEWRKNDSLLFYKLGSI